MKFKYSAEEEPKVPIIDIEILNYSGRSVPEKGKIDTGAAITVIPEYIIDSLTLKKTGEQEIRGFDSVGNYSIYDIYVIIDSKKIGPLQVIASERDNVLLGRNLINLWNLILDGKNRFGEIEVWSTNPDDAY